MVATAAGEVLANGSNLRLREQELAGVLADYRKLPDAQRRPKLPDPNDAIAAKREVPQPPTDGLIVRGYCTYMQAHPDRQFVRAREYYYKENPNRWAAETQSDTLWLTKGEWQSLAPADAKVGDRIEAAPAIQRRFFSTIGIDYMEGSVHSLPPRHMTMTLTAERVTPAAVVWRLDGYAHLGKEFDEKLRGQPNTRGCEVRVLGYLTFSTKSRTITRFDVVGIGKAWGQKRNDRREIRVADYPWTYGIAWELVDGDSPMDLIPPYNLLHYGAAGPYFDAK